MADDQPARGPESPEGAYLPLDAARHALEMHEADLFALVAQGKLRGFRDGKSLKFLRDEIAALRAQGASRDAAPARGSARGRSARPRFLSRTQRRVLCLGAAVLLGMLLYPPWRHRYGPTLLFAENGRTTVYSWLFAPPRKPPAITVEGAGEAEGLTGERVRTEIHTQRLLAQCLGLAVATGLALLALSPKPPR